MARRMRVTIMPTSTYSGEFKVDAVDAHGGDYAYVHPLDGISMWPIRSARHSLRRFRQRD